jgi:hypothetical protein
MSFTKIVFASLVLVVAASFANAEIIGTFAPATIGAGDPISGGLSGYEYTITNNETFTIDALELKFDGTFTQSAYNDSAWYSGIWADTMFGFGGEDVLSVQVVDGETTLQGAMFLTDPIQIAPGESVVAAYLVTDQMPTVGGINGPMPLAASNGVEYTITPEPASMSLLGLGGLALLRRRRNRK